MTPRFALALSAVAAVLAPTAAQAQTTLAISTWVPPAHHINSTIKAWCGEVEQATSNRVKCNLLAKPVAPPHQSLNAVRQGLADASYTVIAYNAEPLNVGMMISVPFAMGANATGERVSAALWRTFRQQLETTGEFKGVKMLSTGAGSPNHMYSTTKALRTAADFKGLKVMVGGKLGADIIGALGGQPTVKPASQLYEMFSGGIVDASINPIETVKSFRIDPFVKNATMFPGGLYSGFGVFYIGEQAWKRISPADQAAIERVSGEKFSRRWGAAFDAEDREALEVMKKNGTAIATASPELVKEISASLAEIRKSLLDAARARGVADPDKVLETVRAEVDKVAKE